MLCPQRCVLVKQTKKTRDKKGERRRRVFFYFSTRKIKKLKTRDRWKKKTKNKEEMLMKKIMGGIACMNHLLTGSEELTSSKTRRLSSVKYFENDSVVPSRSSAMTHARTCLAELERVCASDDFNESSAARRRGRDFNMIDFNYICLFFFFGDFSNAFCG